MRPDNVRMDFGEALAALKRGHRVARKGWNGKGMWIALTPCSEILPENARAGAAQRVAAAILARTDHAATSEMIRIGAHIDMKAADGTLVIGWLASQTDLLAEDWGILTAGGALVTSDGRDVVSDAAPHSHLFAGGRCACGAVAHE